MKKRIASMLAATVLLLSVKLCLLQLKQIGLETLI